MTLQLEHIGFADARTFIVLVFELLPAEAEAHPFYDGKLFYLCLGRRV